MTTFASCTRRVAFAGTILTVASLVHLAISVGIPYREPSPDSADSVAYHLSIHNTIFPLAISLMITGVLGSLLARFLGLFKRNGQ